MSGATTQEQKLGKHIHAGAGSLDLELISKLAGIYYPYMTTSSYR